MSQEFASAKYAAGQLNAMVKELKKFGEDGPERFLRGELVVSEPTRSWREEDGIIYFSVTSDGTTGPDWIMRLKEKKFRVGNYAISVLRSDDFRPTSGVTYNCAVLKGSLFTDSDRITKNIRAEASKLKLAKPNAEIACLIREKFTDKELEEMGLWYIVTMHEPIKDSDGDPHLLGADRSDDGGWLGTCYDNPDDGWDDDGGFAFVVSQVGASD